MAMNVFSPATGQRRALRCEASSVWSAGVSPAGSPPSRRPEAAVSAGGTPAFPIVIAAVLFVALLVPRARREVALRREVREIVTSGDIRARIDARVNGPALLAERSDRGDAYRALRSLLDAKDRDRDIAHGADDEIARRVRELLTIAK